MKTKWLRFAGSFEELEKRMDGKEVKPVSFDGKGLLLVKHEDRFYLVKNKCPHQGITLEKAQCDKGFIVCPWHRYGFDLKTGRGGGGLYLDNYPLEQRADGIYAGFEYFSWF